MGTPAFAADILASLLGWPEFSVQAVFTRPDREAGRGRRLMPSPVKVLALEKGLPVHQPSSMKTEEALQLVQSYEPDFLVVAAYGMILPQAVLDAARLAPVNVHTSLLPAYRGAAPVQRAIMDGCETIGVSIMRMTAGLDCGPFYAQKEVPVGRGTTGSLFGELAAVSAPLLRGVLRDIAEGRAVEHEQDGSLATYAAKVTKAESHVDFSKPVKSVDALIRGLTPDPAAHALFRIGEAEPVSVIIEEAVPEAGGETYPAGSIVATRKKLFVACPDGLLRVVHIRPGGKKSMDAASYINGLRLSLSGPTVIGEALPPQGAAG